MIKVFVYSKDSGKLQYVDTGSPQYVITDLAEGNDFTLTPPPNTHGKWYWIDDKWVADDTAS